MTCGNVATGEVDEANAAWFVGGVVLLLFGAMNFYPHIGMYVNIAHGTNYRW